MGALCGGASSCDGRCNALPEVVASLGRRARRDHRRLQRRLRVLGPRAPARHCCCGSRCCWSRLGRRPGTRGNRREHRAAGEGGWGVGGGGRGHGRPHQRAPSSRNGRTLAVPRSSMLNEQRKEDVGALSPSPSPPLSSPLPGPLSPPALSCSLALSLQGHSSFFVCGQCAKTSCVGDGEGRA